MMYGPTQTKRNHITVIDMEQNKVNNEPRSEPDILSYFPRPVVQTMGSTSYWTELKNKNFDHSIFSAVLMTRINLSRWAAF